MGTQGPDYVLICKPMSILDMALVSKVMTVAHIEILSYGISLCTRQHGSKLYPIAPSGTQVGNSKSVPANFRPESRDIYIYIPRGSNVVPFWLWPLFFLGVIIYYPKGNYF